MLVDNDRPKQRLISKAQIVKAVLKLTDKGVPADELLATLMRSFYVDLDTYNEVVGLSASSLDSRSLDS